ncbi:MAG: cation transporter [Nitrospirae bacterium]|nr:cation transporter [Nitrospirota bacterium]MCL5422647.1 cation transporter [Nitrospirota bacterium]
MADITIKVEGMSCMHCVMRVKKAMESLKGIQSSDVQIGVVRVAFDESAVKKEDIEKAIINAGYKVAA